MDPSSERPRREELAGLSDADLVARFAIGVAHFDRRVLELSDAQLDTAFLPEAGVGRWPARVLLGHLADAEIEDTHRMRRTVAEDGPVLSPWDEEAFINAGLYGTPETGPEHPIAAYIAVIHTLRRWTAPWLATLEPSQWQRRALHQTRGEMTVRSIAEYATWHLENHAWFLNRKVGRLLGA